jgi:AraC family transcriptional regulator
MMTRSTLSACARDAGIAAAEAQHDPGLVLPLHAHPVPCLTYVIEGAFEQRVDGGWRWCRRGDVLLTPAYAAHANRYGETGARSFVIEIPGRFRSAFDDIGGWCSMIRIFSDVEVSRLMDTMLRVCREDSPADLEIEELLGEALSSIRGNAGASRRSWRSFGEAPAWLETIHDRVQSGSLKDFSVAALATEAQLHPDHVSRLFRRYYGFSMTELVRRRRVEHAARMIESSDTALAGIALTAGFSDQSHLTRQLKRYLGVSPGVLARAAEEWSRKTA